MPQTEAPDGANGRGTSMPAGQTGMGNTEEAIQRADVLVAAMGAQLGRWASLFQREATRLAARTREEFEDIWAEAQSMRHLQRAETPRVAANPGNAVEHPEGVSEAREPKPGTRPSMTPSMAPSMTPTAAPTTAPAASGSDRPSRGRARSPRSTATVASPAEQHGPNAS